MDPGQWLLLLGVCALLGLVLVVLAQGVLALLDLVDSLLDPPER